MGHQHETGSGTLTTLVAGAVIGAAGLAWWLLNEADRRSRINRQRLVNHRLTSKHRLTRKLTV